MFTKKRFVESVQVGFIISVVSIVFLLFERFCSPAYSDIEWIMRLNIFRDIQGESILTVISLFILMFLLNFIGLPLHHVFVKLIKKTGMVVEDVEEEIEKRIDIKEKTYLNGDLIPEKTIKELRGNENEKRN